jgi:hypothetical protein
MLLLIRDVESCRDAVVVVCRVRDERNDLPSESSCVLWIRNVQLIDRICI